MQPDILISLETSIDDAWLQVSSTLLGGLPTGAPTPDLYVLIAADGAPKRRLDVYWPKDAFHFTAKAVPWGGKVALGGCDLVHLVEIDTGEAETLALGAGGRWRPPAYFMDFWPAPDDALLILSGCGLVCLEPDGALRWRRDDLALDGVALGGVSDGVVFGEGQVDPPDGWHPFALSLGSGKSIKL